MEDKQVSELTKRLDKIIKLLAIQYTSGKTGKAAIIALSNVGFQPKEVAELVGTTAHTVSVTLNLLKKKRKGKLNEEKSEG